MDVAVEDDDATTAPSYYRLMHHVSSHMNVWVQRAQACISWRRLPRFGYLLSPTWMIVSGPENPIDYSLPSRNLLNFLRGFPSSLLCFLTRRHVKLGIVDPWQISFFAVTLEGSVALDCKSR